VAAAALHGSIGVMRGLVTRVARRIPGLPFLYRRFEALTLRSKPASQVFTEIFGGNKWNGTESVSGLGSDLNQTKVVRRELPVLFSDYCIVSMLDIPCGDFHWMRHVDLHGVDYVGADIVPDLIRRNAERYARSNVQFRTLDLMSEPLPQVDVIFSRDCLVHFSYEDIRRALVNICASNSKYLLATTFPDRPRNHDIVTGQWRPLNLLVPPLSFPAPLRLINEECTQDQGRFHDKSLGLWKVEDIRAGLQ
jgi:hypothetical protein